MKPRFNNPWLDAVWVYCQATEVLAKCIDAELLSDPLKVTQYCLHPSEPRLNPLEFHGKRRLAASAVPAPAALCARGRHQEGNIS
jgi:hypothetical protein